MGLRSFKKLQLSVFTTALLAGALTVSACQQQQEPEPSLEESINSEESIPMSADPADSNDPALAGDDATLSEVQDDTIATVNQDVTQATYLCSPELKVEATYEDDANQVVIGTDKGTLTLVKTNEGSNPEVYQVETALDGGEGFTQWRVAHGERETGVMRTAEAVDENPSVYECKKSD